jgi:hypothetical protein
VDERLAQQEFPGRCARCYSAFTFTFTFTPLGVSLTSESFQTADMHTAARDPMRQS